MLAGDLADTHAKLEGARSAPSTDERQRADEARALVAELRQELAQLRLGSGVRRPPGRRRSAAARRTPSRPSSG